MDERDTVADIHLGIKTLEDCLTKITKQYLLDEEVCFDMFSSTLEHFFSWRIKLEDLENRKWCDGVSDLEVSKNSNNEIYVKGKACILFEDPNSKYYNYDFHGEITLDSNLQEIAFYNIAINFQDEIIHLRK